MNTGPILLIEDDENDVFFFYRAARQAAIPNSIHVVRDGQEALDYVLGNAEFSNRERFPIPALIALDLNLPQRHGLDVLKEIRAAGSTRLTIVVVLTSSTSPEDMTQAYSSGANSYLLKPTNPETLTDYLKLIHDYWLRLNQIPPRSE